MLFFKNGNSEVNYSSSLSAWKKLNPVKFFSIYFLYWSSDVLTNVKENIKQSLPQSN